MLSARGRLRALNAQKFAAKLKDNETKLRDELAAKPNSRSLIRRKIRSSRSTRAWIRLCAAGRLPAAIQDDAPPVVSLEAPAKIRQDQELLVDVSLSDDHTPSAELTQSWAVSYGPGRIAITTEGTRARITFSTFGLYTLRHTASDGRNQTNTDLTIEVAALHGECADGQDNDADGASDMSDFACQMGGPLESSHLSECQDGIDNDGDGNADYDGGPGALSPSYVDAGCESYQDNDERVAASCSDGLDNDGDGWLDAEDPDCTGPNSEETMVVTSECNDGVDNDADGLVDRNDPDCENASDNSEHYGPSHPACSDGRDNDSDGLADFPYDPGCSSADDNSENSELRASESDHLSFTVSAPSEPDTRLISVDWRRDGGTPVRTLWDNYSRRFQYTGDAHKVYLHSLPGYLPKPESWTITRQRGNLVHNREHRDLRYRKILQESDRLIITADDSTASSAPSTLQVTDDLRFTGDTIYLSVTLKNLLNESVRARVPTYLGGLLTGNFDADFQGINWSDPQLARLIPEAGGRIDTDLLNPNVSRPFTYPNDIGTFAPVMAVWGTQPDSFTIGAQVLSPLEWPNYAEFRMLPGADITLKTDLFAELSPLGSRTFVIAYKFAAPGDWQSALSPYRDWFRFWYSSSHRIDTPPAPNYCPQGAFAYSEGSSSNFFNLTTRRYQPNYAAAPPRLTSVFGNPAHLALDSRLGISMFGIWRAAMNSRYLASDGEHEYSGNIDLLDPAFADNRGNPLEQLRDLADLVSASSAHPPQLFAFARPSLKIYGASIKYQTDGSYQITKGPTKWVDLRNSASRAAALSQLDAYVSRGVRGFYSDAGSAPGLTQFYDYAERIFKERYGFKPFIIEEGMRDRTAQKRGQIPLIKGTGAHSLLAEYLTPFASFHGGYINTNLDSGEMSYILERGYQPVLGTVTQASPEICSLMLSARANQHALWANYGNELGCDEPALGLPEACQ